MNSINKCHCRDPFSCILPDYLLEQLADKNPALKERARETIAADRILLANRPAMARLATLESSAAAGGKSRTVFTADNSMNLQRRRLRGENDPPSGNVAADKVYDFFGNTYDFFYSVYGRNSVDNSGMPMVGTVELGPNYNNAFWNGREMGFGTGDGVTFTNFVDSLDVIGHELTHGVVQFNGNGGLAYSGEAGALNESMADVFGVLAKQYTKNQTANQADWLLGSEIMASATCLRSMSNPHDGLGQLRLPNGSVISGQPKHMSELYPDDANRDNYGVHINSGIPNHAFYHFAMSLGGNAWGDAGQVWYDTLTQGNLPVGVENGLQGDRNHGWLQMFADKTTQFVGSSNSQKLKEAWNKVGINVQGDGAGPGPGPVVGNDLRSKLEKIRKDLDDAIRMS